MARKKGTKQHELRRIPNVGVQTQRDLIAMGYTTIDSLKGKRAEELYAEECRLGVCYRPLPTLSLSGCSIFCEYRQS